MTIRPVGGRIGLPRNSALAASKSAVEGVMEAPRLKLEPLGVNVNHIVPRAAATDALATSISAADAPWPARCGVQDADLAPVNSTRVPAGWIPRLKALLPPSSSERTMLRPCPAA